MKHELSTSIEEHIDLLHVFFALKYNNDFL